MSTRADALATRFEQANNEIITLVEQLDEEQWKKITAPEGWGVNVAAHHIAASIPAVLGLVQMTANGQAPPVTMEQINQGNAQHATEFADAKKEETLALLRSGGDQGGAALRGLSDEQLDRTASVIGQQMTVQQVIEIVLIAHPQQHGASIKAAAGI